MPHLTVAQNIFNGRELRSQTKFFLDDKTSIDDGTIAPLLFK